MKVKLVFNSVGVTTHFESSVLSSGCEIEVFSPAFYSCLAWYAKIDDMIDAQLKGFVLRIIKIGVFRSKS